MTRWLRSWWITLRQPRIVRRALLADCTAEDFTPAADPKDRP